MIEWYECAKCGRELPNERARCSRCGCSEVRLACGKRGNPVNLNTASALELERFAGCGKQLAKNIIHHRAAKPFTDVSELRNVRGIGVATYEKMKDKVYVNSDEKCYIDRDALLKRLFPLGIPQTREDWNYSINAKAVYEAIMKSQKMV